ncbi:MAG: methyltransferase [Candidatus Thermoplasmatota archaeon]|nr:methyltransferase [Candidatus Thermoplasmatota archaeon]
MVITYDHEGILYRECEGVYPVREDTLSLIPSIKRIVSGSSGKMLDMGCGTGLATLVASSSGWDVVSVDREPKALWLTRKNLKLNGLRGEQYLSDLFQGLPGRFAHSFDLMVFNPPYLKALPGPMSRREDMALGGGSEGWEVSARFLRGCGNFLVNGGSVLLLSCRGWSISRTMEDMSLGISRDRSEVRDIDGEVMEILSLSSKR